MDTIEAVATALDTGVHVDDAERAARIAVETMAAQGDITDEQIAEAVEQALYPAPTYRLDAIEAVRALLARQAAVHATQVEGFGQRLNLAHYAHQEAKARVVELEAEVKNLAPLSRNTTSQRLGWVR